MNVNKYDKKDLVRVSAVFTDDDNLPVDPTAVIFIVEDPNEVQKGYQYGLSNQGNWNSTANSPALYDGTGTAGYSYTVNVAGVHDFGNDPITFAIGDYVYFNGNVWDKLPSPQPTDITRLSTGSYYYDIYAARKGLYEYEYEGVGEAQAAGRHKFTVKLDD